jgi:hypothetical protein
METLFELPKAPRLSSIHNNALLNSFMAKMDIYEDIPFRDRLEKVKSVRPKLGHHIEEVFGRIDQEYLDYQVLAKRVRMETLSPSDTADREELQNEIKAYKERVYETETYVNDAYRDIYLQYKDSVGKGEFSWEDVDKNSN